MLRWLEQVSWLVSARSKGKGLVASIYGQRGQAGAFDCRNATLRVKPGQEIASASPTLGCDGVLGSSAEGAFGSVAVSLRQAFSPDDQSRREPGMTLPMASFNAKGKPPFTGSSRLSIPSFSQ